MTDVAAQYRLAGLNAAQIALNVTAQNMCRVNTLGYSRQEAMMGSLSGFGRLDNGMGVEVTGVRRITDDYLVSQHWRSRSSTGSSYAFHQYINTTEQLLGSESMNITKGLDSFFASLSAALDSPETPAQRQPDRQLCRGAGQPLRPVEREPADPGEADRRSARQHHHPGQQLSETGGRAQHPDRRAGLQRGSTPRLWKPAASR